MGSGRVGSGLVGPGVTRIVLAVAALWMVGCSSEPPPFEGDQSSPEAVIATAQRMVVEGRADLLPSLIWDDGDANIRLLLDGMGQLFGTLHSLTGTLQEAFPSDIARVQREALEAAEEGKSSSRLAAFLTGQQRSAPSRLSESDDPLNDFAQQLLSDPYGWLERNADRLGTQTITGRMVALTWDERPVMPPIGVVLEQQDDGNWYISAPFRLPPVRRFLPETDEETEIWLSLLAVINNALADVEDDVESGQIRSLERAAEEFGKKVIMPVALVGFAIGKSIENRSGD